jgi:DNA-binding transcriptional LysR family regulator
MELRNVRGFLAVAGERHFGRAAAGLNLTQPALTLRIQSLERELGVQLLERNSREVRLTTAGEALLLHARRLVQEEDRTLRVMKDYAGGLTGHLRISYLTLWDIGLPANIVAEFRSRYPGIELEMTTGYSQTNLERLLAGELDLAFIGVAIGEREQIAIRPLDRHEIVVAMMPTHPLAQMDRIPVECLRGEPMVAVSAGVNGPVATAIRGWLTKYTGEPPNIVQEEPPDQITAAVAHSGNTIALMTVRRASLAQAEGLVYRRLSPAPSIEYGVAYPRENHSPALANLLKTVEDLVPPLAADLPPDAELLVAGPARVGTTAG